MNCLEFRRQVGADPGSQQASLLAHAAACATCARHRQELQAMDALLLRALSVQAPEHQAAVRAPARRWQAIAASLVAGIAIGLTLWLANPQPTLAHEVMGHVHSEMGAFRPSTPLDETDIAATLGPHGLRLRPGLGEVTFAERCLFEGQVVPHLVVNTAAGRVTVLLLIHRGVSEPTRLSDPQFAGVVLPAPRGSIAIIGEGPMDLEQVARQVFEAIDWGQSPPVA